jgi:hypothetical protein
MLYSTISLTSGYFPVQTVHPSEFCTEVLYLCMCKYLRTKLRGELSLLTTVLLFSGTSICTRYQGRNAGDTRVHVKTAWLEDNRKTKRWNMIIQTLQCFLYEALSRYKLLYMLLLVRVQCVGSYGMLWVPYQGAPAAPV